MEKERSVEERLSAIGVKSILVARNIDAMVETKSYFSNCGSIKIDYATTAKDASQMIRDAYKSSGYDIVMLDLNLEGPLTGLKVMGEAVRHYAAPAVFPAECRDLPIDFAMEAVVLAT
jgi:hypothetical protein